MPRPRYPLDPLATSPAGRAVQRPLDRVREVPPALATCLTPGRSGLLFAGAATRPLGPLQPRGRFASYRARPEAHPTPGTLGPPPTCLRANPSARGARGPGVHSHVGMVISHARPSVRQSSRTSPPTWPRIIASITCVPKPLRVGGVTDGPPASAHRSTTRPSAACDHSTRTLPFSTDRAPYFAALVASSCKATAMDCAKERRGV
jgi:hypothetical protein